MFTVNDNVKYTFLKTGTIDKIHRDDYPNLYYSIKLNKLDKIIQTTKDYLIFQNEDIKEGDQIIYKKIYDTKIYNIKDEKYKIKYKDKYKYVNSSKLTNN